jgi:hypothetical protein
MAAMLHPLSQSSRRLMGRRELVATIIPDTGPWS